LPILSVRPILFESSTRMATVGGLLSSLTSLKIGSRIRSNRKNNARARREMRRYLVPWETGGTVRWYAKIERLIATAAAKKRKRSLVLRRSLTWGIGGTSFDQQHSFRIRECSCTELIEVDSTPNRLMNRTFLNWFPWMPDCTIYAWVGTYMDCFYFFP